jgi:hypothetical protein
MYPLYQRLRKKEGTDSGLINYRFAERKINERNNMFIQIYKIHALSLIMQIWNINMLSLAFIRWSTGISTVSATGGGEGGRGDIEAGKWDRRGTPQWSLSKRRSWDCQSDSSETAQAFVKMVHASILSLIVSTKFEPFLQLIFNVKKVQKVIRP